MKTIKLYGILAKKFGKVFTLDVKTSAEAIRALCIVVPGFKNHLIKYSEPGYKVLIDRQAIFEEELHNPISDKEVIKIIPYVVGAGGGFGKIVLGAVLIAVALSLPGGSPIAPYLMKAGVAIAFSGIAQVLFSPPKPAKPNEKPENKPSYAFDGPVNTVLQGNPVPLAYGKLRVGSQVISAGLYAEEINV